MRVLVTGLSGFTGQYVKNALETKGHQVVGLSSDLTVSRDLLKEIEQVQPQAVIHLAAIAFVGHGNANAFYEVNLIGSRNLLHALAKKAPDVKSILLVSSANVYGNRFEGVLSEEDTPDPVNDYAVSKLAMEHMARLWHDQLPLFIVRPFNYTGVGQSENFLIPKIVDHFRHKKQTIQLGNLDVYRDFSDVRSVADAYCGLIEFPPIGRTLNICSGETHSIREIIDLCIENTGHAIEVQVAPSLVRKNEVKVLKGDKSRLMEVLGSWDSINFPKTLQWMLRTNRDY